MLSPDQPSCSFSSSSSSCSSSSSAAAAAAAAAAGGGDGSSAYSASSGSSSVGLLSLRRVGNERVVHTRLRTSVVRDLTTEGVRVTRDVDSIAVASLNLNFFKAPVVFDIPLKQEYGIPMQNIKIARNLEERLDLHGEARYYDFLFGGDTPARLYVAVRIPIDRISDIGRMKLRLLFLKKVKAALGRLPENAVTKIHGSHEFFTGSYSSSKIFQEDWSEFARSLMIELSHGLFDDDPCCYIFYSCSHGLLMPFDVARQFIEARFDFSGVVVDDDDDDELHQDHHHQEYHDFISSAGAGLISSRSRSRSHHRHRHSSASSATTSAGRPLMFQIHTAVTVAPPPAAGGGVVLDPIKLKEALLFSEQESYYYSAFGLRGYPNWSHLVPSRFPQISYLQTYVPSVHLLKRKHDNRPMSIFKDVLLGRRGDLWRRLPRDDSSTSEGRKKLHLFEVFTNRLITSRAELRIEAVVDCLENLRRDKLIARADVEETGRAAVVTVNFDKLLNLMEVLLKVLVDKGALLIVSNFDEHVKKSRQLIDVLRNYLDDDDYVVVDDMRRQKRMPSELEIRQVYDVENYLDFWWNGTLKDGDRIINYSRLREVLLNGRLANSSLSGVLAFKFNSDLELKFEDFSHCCKSSKSKFAKNISSSVEAIYLHLIYESIKYYTAGVAGQSSSPEYGVLFANALYVLRFLLPHNLLSKTLAIDTAFGKAQFVYKKIMSHTPIVVHVDEVAKALLEPKSGSFGRMVVDFYSSLSSSSSLNEKSLKTMIKDKVHLFPMALLGRPETTATTKVWAIVDDSWPRVVEIEKEAEGTLTRKIYNLKQFKDYSRKAAAAAGAAAKAGG